MKKIAVLGSTGSVGKSVLQTARHLQDEIQIIALTCQSNIDLLQQQIIEFNPEIVAVYDKDKALELIKRGVTCRVAAGKEGLEEVASYPIVNQVIVAIVGTAALYPTLTAIQTHKSIGLANKEVLLTAGEFIMSQVKKYGTELIPIDSEHSAIFQCLKNEPQKHVKKIILTASGGPFLHHSHEQLESIQAEDALRHPTWKMGQKITIDSSTLMNKGFEVIEAYFLFNIPIDQIEVIIHPQSIVHSFVEFIDNTLLAQIGEPSMLVPIQYALTHPKRLPGQLEPFDFTKHEKLEFFKPDKNKFSCLKLAYEAIKIGKSLPCYMNAANEVLVQRFLNKEISWLSISQKLEKLMNKHQLQQSQSLDNLLQTDEQARIEAQTI